jgi:putative ABC transport system permease protein
MAQMAVEPEEWLDMYPEYVLTPAERQAWVADRTGAIAGRALADRFGWKVGDRIPIQGTIWRRKDGSKLWEFTLDGIYEPGEEGIDDTQFFFQYDFLDEARQFGEGLVGWYVVRIADPQHADAIAEAIDAEFANSPTETKTATEKAFVQAFANQIGDIGTIVTAILAAVFFTMLLVAGNTMAQAVRERTGELAVLKTVGFTDGKVLGLVLAESLAVAALGGALGLAVGWVVVAGVASELGAFLPTLYARPRDLALGAVLVAFVGVAAGILPALQAMRLEVVQALRR